MQNHKINSFFRKLKYRKEKYKLPQNPTRLLINDKYYLDTLIVANKFKKNKKIYYYAVTYIFTISYNNNVIKRQTQMLTSCGAWRNRMFKPHVKINCIGVCNIKHLWRIIQNKNNYSNFYNTLAQITNAIKRLENNA